MRLRFHISFSVVIALFVLFPRFAFSQDTTDYYQEGYIQYDNFVYRKNIKTVVFEREFVRLSEPILELGSMNRLVLSFDDLDGDVKYYSYTLIHCDANWQPSNLIPNDYITGFTEDRITNYRTSFNTIQDYTHYEQEIPGREVIPFLSGNYIVKVYIEGEADKPIITRRMMVLDSRMKVEGIVKRATIVSDMELKQEIDFAVDYEGIKVMNPFDEIKVVLMQNGRWDNAISNLKPLYLKDHLLEYDFEEGNTFNGGNEFRMFDLRTVRIYTEFVQKIIEGEDGFSVILVPSISRSFSRYSIQNDINGKFLIKNQDGRDDNLEGEYVKVKMTLKHDILTNGNFYVFGALTDWRIGSENKMEYNYDNESYELLLYLKQGYYDYEYVFVKDGTTIPDETVVEGSHKETSNEYTILVYFKPVGARYDRLVGFKTLSSRW